MKKNKNQKHFVGLKVRLTHQKQVTEWFGNYNSVQTLLVSCRGRLSEGEWQWLVIFVDHVFSGVPDRDRASSRNPGVTLIAVARVHSARTSEDC